MGQISDLEIPNSPKTVANFMPFILGCIESFRGMTQNDPKIWPAKSPFSHAIFQPIATVSPFGETWHLVP